MLRFTLTGDETLVFEISENDKRAVCGLELNRAIGLAEIFGARHYYELFTLCSEHAERYQLARVHAEKDYWRCQVIATSTQWENTSPEPLWYIGNADIITREDTPAQAYERARDMLRERGIE